MTDLRFGGSVWCNLDAALRAVDEIYKQETKALGLSVIEWYILRVLYEQDGQMASHLAQAVGRAGRLLALSFGSLPLPGNRCRGPTRD